MKLFLKNLLVKATTYSGLPVLFREYIQRKKVTMIVLHNPGPDTLSKHFEWLSAHYNIISLDQYLDYREGKSEDPLPDKSLVITIDDGHIDNYKLLPLIKSTSIPVTIFLCSGIINTNRHYWFKFAELIDTSEALKYIPNELRLKCLANSGFQTLKEYPEPQALNKMQIEEMAPYVNFQGHTVFHPCLPRCTDEESRKEIHESKKQLESEYNFRINAIAYPNGDYTKREINYVRESGYRCGLTVGYGFNSSTTDLFALKRFSVSDDDSVEMLAIKASGNWFYIGGFIKKIWRRIRYQLLFSGRKFMGVFVAVVPMMEDVAWF